MEPNKPQEGQQGGASTLALAQASLTAYKAQIERLKAENVNLKRTVRQMERRIMRSEHQDE